MNPAVADEKVVDAVADAIAASIEADVFHDLSEGGILKESYRQQARAAIAAFIEAGATTVRGVSEAMVELLTEVRDNGIIYWEPNTHRGDDAKAAMLDKLDRAIAALAAAPEAVGPDLIEHLQAENDRLTEALAFADKQAEKLEALLEPHIAWEDEPTPQGAPTALQEARDAAFKDSAFIRAALSEPAGDGMVPALAKGCYMMSEPHLSGYRLIIGFDTLPAVHDAMQAVADAVTAYRAALTTADQKGGGE